ncbi:DUF389 domain-containing protein [Aetokthonos hydrillicola Thurmond2011]|jgi:uncharacterized hydrophobic protein (TIGR00271 family)|uniref:DUF389 domain-containing protein n=2 Tax=Aetokthonos TaxID=1550243 RepID=A0AAP5IA60_9CYAN|nr:DUF389 domain-containing protein [Aetokthonos hydrillicola]MBO3461575.1 DUF389 domain-containing protein [Aetokthonos hydrillicola CCALA 1050]MBW4586123.1 DUF389 domain-containing protein [Aetokthonos hydrillicola CCALA 1050]MDR9897728.1 DUF389 domain-containing protein [Aetokthonos hydrillicola Thurmond2011]
MFNHIRERFKYYSARRVTPQNLQQLRTDLLVESTLDVNYLVLILGSCAIATLGLLSNSAAVIIGAMIIAPLMLPIRGLAFGALDGDVILVRFSITAISVGTVLAIILAAVLGRLVGLAEFGNEVLVRSKPNLLDLGIALAAGGIGGFALVKPKVANSLAGVAIAVALMPPVCVIGLGLSRADWSLSLGATLLYLTNLLGITFSCMLVFLITGWVPLARARRALVWTLAFTSVLLIPLAVSFVRLVRQSQLEAALKSALLNKTVTFQRVTLLKSDTNWLTDPPEVHLSVRSHKAVTPKQVRLLEEFVSKVMRKKFILIFEVSQVEQVTGEDLDKSSGRTHRN